MPKRGDSFRPLRLSPAGRGGDRFGQGLPVAEGFYPRGPAARQAGESRYPSLLAQYNRDQSWSSWRQGMKLAFTQLFNSSSQYLPAQVVRYGGLQAGDGFQISPALLVAFPSRSSPEGRWTVAVKPRGSDITAEPLVGALQREVLHSGEGGEPLRLLAVDVSRSWRPGSLAAASALIGELVEDSALSASLVAPVDDEALILLCIAAYPDLGMLVFDGSRRWRRELQANGRRILREERILPTDPIPTFRPERHLCQSVTLSCNCPAHLGLEYGRFTGDGALGSQGRFPSRAPGSEAPATPLRLSLSEMLFSPPTDPVRAEDPLEGVARRFFQLNWQRLPIQGCKHVHAVRFAIGCPVAEPDEYISLVSDYWDGLRGNSPIDELAAPLASDRFVGEMARVQAMDQAWGTLSSTMTSGAVGDAFGVVPGRLRLLALQASPSAGGNELVRFNEQAATAEPRAAEASVAGDIWVGRGTSAVALPYSGPGEVIDEAFYQFRRQQATAIYP